MTPPPQDTPEDTFERLGRITRNLHEAMTQLGLDQSLHAIAQEFPDARDRLSHVGHMTEAAATKVLNLIDSGQPDCQEFKARSQAFAQALDAPQGGASTEAAAHCHGFARAAQQFADNQNLLLTEIMMTQDFQDLSGQIIKKVIGIISQTESQLLELLMHSAPERLAAVVQPKAELAGPQVPDKALKQDDVDDLLASLGF
jgi:chemotaxis protein CheZ